MNLEKDEEKGLNKAIICPTDEHHDEEDDEGDVTEYQFCNRKGLIFFADSRIFS